MSLEYVTKEEFDKEFKNKIQAVEKMLKEDMKVYNLLLDFRSQYRKDYESNRVTHQIDFEKGIITYKLNSKRKIGFQIPYVKKEE